MKNMKWMSSTRNVYPLRQMQDNSLLLKILILEDECNITVMLLGLFILGDEYKMNFCY